MVWKSNCDITDSRPRYHSITGGGTRSVIRQAHGWKCWDCHFVMKYRVGLFRLTDERCCRGTIWRRILSRSHPSATSITISRSPTRTQFTNVIHLLLPAPSLVATRNAFARKNRVIGRRTAAVPLPLVSSVVA